ncbi:MAG: rhomboid family intramembrane serine protease [Byssovorax sp.]
MDQNSVFLPLAAFSSLLLFVRALRQRAWGWASATGIVLLVAAAGELLFPDRVGYLAGAIWLVLVAIPSLGYALVGRLGNRQRYAAAARVASIVRFLHPMDGWWDRPRILRALALAQAGAFTEASARLVELEQSSPRYAREARMHRLRMESRWDEVLAWLRARIPEADLLADPALLFVYLRALGEVGELDALVASYRRAEPVLARADGGRSVSLLFVFAFTGRADRVASLFRGPLASYSEALKSFWLATADLAAGAHPADRKAPREVLADLVARADASLVTSARRRLDDPIADAATSLSIESLVTLGRLEKERDQEDRYGDQAGAIASGAWATLALMVPNLAMFVVELLAGCSLEGRDADEPILTRLGAVQPDLVLAGQWWRLVAATLLHFGWLHVTMNLGGLYVLGPYVERALGRVRFVVTYLLAGIGMMLIAVLVARFRASGAELLVGASGGIMGLVGATVAVLLRGGRVEGSPVAKRRLRAMALIVVAQSGFDLVTPQVSFMSHLGGVIIGFLVAAMMKHTVTPAAAK